MIVMPVSSPLFSFKSQNELLLGLIDGLEVHQRLFRERGILHRDINPNNLVFHESESGDAPVRKLVLIDFDHVVSRNDATVEYPKIPFPQTSLPFLSLTILNQFSRAAMTNQHLEIQHEMADDLESFFYVFAFICVFFTGPEGTARPESQVDDLSGPILLTWGLDTSGRGLSMGGKLTAVRNAKEAFSYVIDGGFAPYFRNLKELAVGWRGLVEEEDERRDPWGRAQEEDAIPLTHRAVIRLLQGQVDVLEDVPPRMSKKMRSNSYGSVGAE